MNSTARSFRFVPPLLVRHYNVGKVRTDGNSRLYELQTEAISFLKNLFNVNPVPRTYVRGFRACPSGTSEHFSLHLRTGRSVVRGKPCLLRRAQSRWGFQRGKAAALPFGLTRGFKPRVRYNLIKSLRWAPAYRTAPRCAAELPPCPAQSSRYFPLPHGFLSCRTRCSPHGESLMSR